MVARVADVKFKDSELESIPLETKLEYILEDLFAAVPGLKRRSAAAMDVEVELTESDQDY